MNYNIIIACIEIGYGYAFRVTRCAIREKPSKPYPHTHNLLGGFFMDKYNILVLMEKDSETGFFTQTVDSYKIDVGIELIENGYLAEEAGEYFIYLALTTADVEDYQYYGIYDLYDEEVLTVFDVELLDGSGEFNPRWIVKMEYIEVRSEMEGLVNELVEVHRNELQRVLPLVEADKKKYIEEIEKEE